MLHDDHNKINQEESNNQEYSLVQHIEAILFWRGDPVSLSTLAKITSAKKEAIEKALVQLRRTLSNRGIILIEHENEFTLGTNPESAKLIEKVRTEELSKDLGKASLETLAIVLYQGPIRRSEIDYIRGVNSNFILRNLLVRGLIERKADPEDSRAAVYSPSIELLRFMGLSRVTELPDFDRVKEAIREFKAADADETQANPIKHDSTEESVDANQSETIIHSNSTNENDVQETLAGFEGEEEDGEDPKSLQQ